MIAKEELIKGLQELIRIEEGIITLHINFSRVLLNFGDKLSHEKRGKIERLLANLYQDSSEHRKLIDKMIKEITASSKNEF